MERNGCEAGKERAQVDGCALEMETTEGRVEQMDAQAVSERRSCAPLLFLCCPTARWSEEQNRDSKEA